MIQELGNVPESDMRTTFNLGIGLVMVISKDDESRTISLLEENGENPVIIGQVMKAS